MYTVLFCLHFLPHDYLYILFLLVSLKIPTLKGRITSASMFLTACSSTLSPKLTRVLRRSLKSMQPSPSISNSRNACNWFVNIRTKSKVKQKVELTIVPKNTAKKYHSCHILCWKYETHPFANFLNCWLELLEDRHGGSQWTLEWYQSILVDSVNGTDSIRICRQSLCEPGLYTTLEFTVIHYFGLGGSCNISTPLKCYRKSTLSG